MLVKKFVVLSLLMLCLVANSLAQINKAPRVIRFTNPSNVEISYGGAASRVRVGQRVGPYTLMEILPPRGTQTGLAILEDFTEFTGHLLIINTNGIQLDLPKSMEPTSTEKDELYLGHTLAEVIDSPSDLLGNEILAKGGDPEYGPIADVLPPIHNIRTYSFLGTQESPDKVPFEYGGRTPDFDPAPYYAPINQIRTEQKVQDGLVGGYLPILRFVYPEASGAWTEMIAFAPLRQSNANDRIQPIWYRTVHIEQGQVKWAKYVDSYHPFPPRTKYDPKIFYRDLLALRRGWDRKLAGGISIQVPDARMQNMASFALVREMMTRIGSFPKYGVVDRDYGGSEHDGFPDTFTVDTTAMLSWGLVPQAGQYIENYFSKFVRDDGSILYRGPEIGQYGRMLTVLAQYVDYGGNPELLIRLKSRIDGVTNLLLGLRSKARLLPKNDPAYGMISGWSEADASLDAHPERYMQPYFSNSAEAARGFRDIGRVWIELGEVKKIPDLVKWGKHLLAESEELRADLKSSMAKSTLTLDDETILPSIAGAKEPFHVVVPRDNSDPQFRSYRAYMEMMYSGLLPKEQVERIVRYRTNHHDVVLGVPTAYGYKTGAMAGFLAYGHGYGLIQHDDIERSLLLMYSIMAHQFTRGTWMAPETRPVFDNSPAAPYCPPAQLVVPMMLRWMLVFEDPTSETVWLGKGIPRAWLEDGKVVSVAGAPTRWGRIGFKTESHVKDRKIIAAIDLPNGKLAATLKLRLRAPSNRPLRSVMLNGKSWTQFDPKEETITIPTGQAGSLKIEAQY